MKVQITLIVITILLLFLAIYILLDIKEKYKIKTTNRFNKIITFILLFVAFGCLLFSFQAETFFNNEIEKILENKPESRTDLVLIHGLKGQLGDKMGGLMNPFISIAAVIVTGLAFYAQYNANKLIQDQFKIQQFETKYYELLRIHNDNVKMMKISDSIESRKCFVHMFYELRICYYIFENTKTKLIDKNIINNQNSIDLMHMVYQIFFFGIGPNSEKMYMEKLNENEKLVCKTGIKELRKIQLFYNNKKSIKKNKKFVVLNFLIDFETKLYYFPFDGHQNKLGHYYRHLFQTVKYIVESELLNIDQKYSYIKTCRAQLSNYEQLLLYYNALGWFETEWHELFTDYRLIKNLPIQLADFDQLPLEYFKDDIERLGKNNIKMFEWLEY